MPIPNETLWKIESHTLAKHEILRRYLGAWFPILAKYNEQIIFLDGFCGPGRYKGGEEGSPIIALQEAIKHSTRIAHCKIIFLFIDNDKRRIDHLSKELELLSKPSNFMVYTILDEFDNFKNILNDLESDGSHLPPTFAFIDPFGFKGVSFEIVKRLLKNPMTEVFININLNSINRFIEHPDQLIRQQILDLFGTPEAFSVINSGIDRFAELRMLYQTQLLKYARFVRYFEMHDYHNRIIYCLFFATKHPLGHVKMKDAFWRVDPTSGFKFSDQTDPGQLILFDIDPYADLSIVLSSKFSGERVPVSDIRKFVEDETPYIAKHMRNALKHLLQSNQISVDPFQSDGKKWISNTFPDKAMIKFLDT